MAWYRCGGGGIPSSLKTDMNAVLNKKFGTSTDYPPADWAPTVNLMGPLPEKTVSSSPVADFSDGADDVPTKSLVVTIPPTLSGVSSVTETQTGRNLLSMVNYDGGVYNPDVDRVLNLTVSETQFTKNGNVYSVTTSATWKTFTVLFPIVAGVTYYEKWTLSIESGQQGSTRAYLDEDFKVLAKYNSNSSDPIITNGVMTPPTGARYLAITWTNRSTAVQTLNITDPMIEIGSTSSTWEEYNVTTYTANLGRTIYGGQADIVNGEGTENCTNRNLVGTGFTWVLNTTDASFPFFTIGADAPNKASNKNFVCEVYVNRGNYRSLLQDGEIGVFNNTAGINRFCVRDDSCTTLEQFLEKNANTKITYEVTTPTDFTFTGQEIPTRLGVNNFWSDSGDTEVTYRADIDLLLGGN